MSKKKSKSQNIPKSSKKKNEFTAEMEVSVRKLLEEKLFYYDRSDDDRSDDDRSYDDDDESSSSAAAINPDDIWHGKILEQKVNVWFWIQQNREKIQNYLPRKNFPNDIFLFYLPGTHTSKRELEQIRQIINYFYVPINREKFIRNYFGAIEYLSDLIPSAEECLNFLYFNGFISETLFHYYNGKFNFINRVWESNIEEQYYYLSTHGFITSLYTLWLSFEDRSVMLEQIESGELTPQQSALFQKIQTIDEEYQESQTAEVLDNLIKNLETREKNTRKSPAINFSSTPVQRIRKSGLRNSSGLARELAAQAARIEEKAQEERRKLHERLSSEGIDPNSAAADIHGYWLSASDKSSSGSEKTSGDERDSPIAFSSEPPSQATTSIPTRQPVATQPPRQPVATQPIMDMYRPESSAQGETTTCGPSGCMTGIMGGKRKTRRKRKPIKINKKMKGVFTRKAKKHKMSVQKYARYVIKKFKGKTKNKRQLKLLRQAVFAKTAKKWKKRKRRRKRKKRSKRCSKKRLKKKMICHRGSKKKLKKLRKLTKKIKLRLTRCSKKRFKKWNVKKKKN